MSVHYDVIIIGAGAAGLMCGAVAGGSQSNLEGRSVLILDHAEKPGQKIRISGGGRCNFTNLLCGPSNFISENPHFCKSALSRYGPHDFIDLVNSYGLQWYEKEQGQLFCQNGAQAIIDMLLAECDRAGNTIWLGTQIADIRPAPEQDGADGPLGFIVTTERQSVSCDSLVVACGGASIPKMGASRYGYKLAEQFGLPVVEPQPALVPLTFTDAQKAPLKDLSGVSVTAAVSAAGAAFTDELLFTHRGLSGPAILQISSYWSPGDALTIDLAPGIDFLPQLKAARRDHPRQNPKTWLSQYMPQRLAAYICSGLKYERLADMSDAALTSLALQVSAWLVYPAGTEGFRTAEVTRGGVDTRALSSKTFEALASPGLYFIGEVVDVTGHLGGHNFQWAWASAVVCGLELAHKK